jgi:hypothetical protein
MGEAQLWVIGGKAECNPRRVISASFLSSFAKNNESES